jgi:hypothetical protein
MHPHSYVLVSQPASLEELIQKAKTFVAAAKAPATLKACRNDWRDFESWCGHHQLPSLPSTPETVALYIAERASTLASGTVTREVLDFLPTQRYCCVVTLPPHQPDGLLPPGVHICTWDELRLACGSSAYRASILAGLLVAAKLLAQAGCRSLYIDGSFVTSKAFPGDFDACWDIAGVNVALVDPVFFDFRNKRAAQKARFKGELFLAHGIAAPGFTFFQFFQRDKNSGKPKGIVALDLGSLPT